MCKHEEERVREYTREYTKLVITDEMLEYVMGKYGKKWSSEDENINEMLDDLWLKDGKG